MSDTFTETVGGRYNSMINILAFDFSKYSFSLGFFIPCLALFTPGKRYPSKMEILRKCLTLIFYKEETFIILFCDQHLSCSACI